MGNWNQYLYVENNETPKHHSKKPDKKHFCRKNKEGTNYGPHVYVHDRCIYCKRYAMKSTFISTTNEETEGDNNER